MHARYKAYIYQFIYSQFYNEDFKIAIVYIYSYILLCFAILFIMLL